MSKEKSYMKYDLPKVFERKPGDRKVIVKDMYYKVLKTTEILSFSSKDRWLALKVGKGKATSWYKYMPVIIEDNIYTLVEKNPKRKYCVFNFMGPYDDMENILKDNESTIVNG